VRIGKYLEVQLQAPDEATAARQVDERRRRLLANPVIEGYCFTPGPAPSPAATA
jgi:phosphoribosylformylglycinamidine synthase PurS subunit